MSAEEMAEQYTYNVYWSKEDKVFIARVVELSSLIAHSKSSRDKAFYKLYLLVKDVLEELERNGEPVPKPQEGGGYVRKRV
jgi:predicted RNase H-like HicB family nuclease